MSFTHYINGIPVVEPKEWRNFEQEIVRDLERRTISTKYPGSSTFTRGAYRMLRDMFVADDCGIVVYECFEECGGTTLLVVRANIILSDCKWNLTRCEVECSLVDDGVDARITNNRGIPISPQADKSKNGVAIVPVPVLDLVMFNPGTFSPTTSRFVFDWFLCMQHAVQYMTDGNVTLVSQWYANLPIEERWAVTTGFQFRTGDTTPEGIAVVYKFEELFLEMAKKYNLWMTIRRDVNGTAIVYIEQEAGTFVDQVAASFAFTDGVIQSVDREQLWARVDVGSENGTKNQGNVEALPFLTLLGFSLEEFHFETQCNTDAVLDLVSKYTICTNTLERMLNGDTGEDSKNALIQYTLGAGQATAGFWFNPDNPDPLYNPAILNREVLERYALPSSVGQFTAPLLGAFLASGTNGTAPVTYSNTLPPNVIVTQPGPQPVFNDDTTLPNNDPDGAWDVGTQRYTALQNGFYQLRMRMNWGGGGFGVAFRPRVIAQTFDSLNVLVTTQEQSAPFRQGSPADYVDNFQFGAVMNTGDYMVFTLVWDLEGLVAPNVTALFLRAGSILFTDFVAQGGGVTGNNIEARVITYEFDRITTAARWKSMVDDPRQAIEVAPFDDLKVGHIKRASRNIYKGTTSYELICKRSQK
jgi:hypothetical protein